MQLVDTPQLPSDQVAQHFSLRLFRTMAWLCLGFPHAAAAVAMVVVNGSYFHMAIESTHETCVMLQVGEEKRFRKAGGWYLSMWEQRPSGSFFHDERKAKALHKTKQRCDIKI